MNQHNKHLGKEKYRGGISKRHWGPVSASEGRRSVSLGEVSGSKVPLFILVFLQVI